MKINEISNTSNNKEIVNESKLKVKKVSPGHYKFYNEYGQPEYEIFDVKLVPLLAQTEEFGEMKEWWEDYGKPKKGWGIVNYNSSYEKDDFSFEPTKASAASEIRSRYEDY